jgi:hypothetical protein
MISIKKKKTEAKQIVSTPNLYLEKTLFIEHSEFILNFDSKPGTLDIRPKVVYTSFDNAGQIFKSPL